MPFSPQFKRSQSLPGSPSSVSSPSSPASSPSNSKKRSFSDSFIVSGTNQKNHKADPIPQKHVVEVIKQYLLRIAYQQWENKSKNYVSLSESQDFPKDFATQDLVENMQYIKLQYPYLFPTKGATDPKQDKKCILNKESPSNVKIRLYCQGKVNGCDQPNNNVTKTLFGTYPLLTNLVKSSKTSGDEMTCVIGDSVYWATTSRSTPSPTNMPNMPNMPNMHVFKFIFSSTFASASTSPSVQKPECQLHTINNVIIGRDGLCYYTHLVSMPPLQEGSSRMKEIFSFLRSASAASIISPVFSLPLHQFVYCVFDEKVYCSHSGHSVLKQGVLYNEPVSENSQIAKELFRLKKTYGVALVTCLLPSSPTSPTSPTS